MAVSLMNSCSASNVVLNQSNLESTMHWRQSPQAASPENDFLGISNQNQQPSSPIQNGDESCLSSENGVDMLTPPQASIRSPTSEDTGENMFPVSGCNVAGNNFMDFSSSDNDRSTSSPSSSHDDETYRSDGKGSGNGTSNKPKVHKCKNCNFTTTSKYESWEHVAMHLKPEKILRCTECPFVTEYKHHLDFHIWNHQGMKPFKCDQCSYSCVNKSMLKSHMKSHSNVYQYSCADCAYRTKYCHSLKIHLRKYHHEPGMVLDSEGNPNPHPVIDVYGNRRGPKSKPRKHENSHHAAVATLPAANTNSTLPPARLMPATLPTLGALPHFAPWIKTVLFPADPAHHTLLPAAAAASLLAPAFPPPEGIKMELGAAESDNLNNNVKLAVNNNVTLNNHNHPSVNGLQMPKTTVEASVKRDGGHVKREPCSDDDEKSSNSNTVSLPPLTSPYYLPVEQTTTPPTTTCERPAAASASTNDAPLNLSVSHSSNWQTDCGAPIAPKNRRKGVACKLKRPLTDEKDACRTSTSPPSSSSSESCATGRSSSPSSANCHHHHHHHHHHDGDAEDGPKNAKKNSLHCDFCEITFFNRVMFTMHMGYHGFSDPFTCNRCGHKTETAIDFFNHLLSAEH